MPLWLWFFARLFGRFFAWAGGLLSGGSQLAAASAAGRVEEVRALIAARADIYIEESDWDGQTPLFVASREGRLEVAQMLLDAGANTDAKNKVRGGGGLRFGCGGCSVHERSPLLNSDVKAGGDFFGQSSQFKVRNRANWKLDGNTRSLALNVVLELALLNKGFSIVGAAYQMGKRSRGWTLT